MEVCNVLLKKSNTESTCKQKMQHHEKNVFSLKYYLSINRSYEKTIKLDKQYGPDTLSLLMRFKIASLILSVYARYTGY